MIRVLERRVERARAVLQNVPEDNRLERGIALLRLHIVEEKLAQVMRRAEDDERTRSAYLHGDFSRD